jgi:hypothetical protein
MLDYRVPTREILDYQIKKFASLSTSVTKIDKKIKLIVLHEIRVMTLFYLSNEFGFI